MKTVDITNFNKRKSRVNTYRNRSMFRCPFVTLLVIFAGIPLLTLSAVFVVVYMIALPLGVMIGYY